MQLFASKTSPSHKFDTLTRLRTQRDAKTIELQRLNTQIATLETELNQLLGSTEHPSMPVDKAPTATHTQQPATTQALPVQTNRTKQPTQEVVATQIRPNTNAVPSTPNTIQSRLAPSIAAPAGIPGMAAIINNRAPYHTQELQITGVTSNGQIIMHKHYLSGDGVLSGIQALEECAVTHHVSKAGKPYRQMETPALKITCALSQALPQSIAEKNRVIREWMSANNWLTSCDQSKAVFETEYNAYGNTYTPYVSIDSIGTTLYIYIGCTSMVSAKPCPTLIQ